MKHLTKFLAVIGEQVKLTCINAEFSSETSEACPRYDIMKILFVYGATVNVT
jgi:hypothetical protein